MKVKIRFPGMLLSLLKHCTLNSLRAHYAKDPELYYAAALVVLWLVVFILIHL